MHTKKIAQLLIGLFILGGCGAFKGHYIKKIDHVLTIDTLHNTPEKKKKYAAIERFFLDHWQKDSTCYTQYIGYSRTNRQIQWDDNVLEYEIVNILPSINYDTAVVFVSWYSCCFNDHEGITLTSPFVLIQERKSQKWSFVCYKPHFQLSGYGRKAQLKHFSKASKYLMARGAFLTQENEIDTTFAYRVLTDPYIWFDTMEENMEKGRLLRKSMDDYYNYLKSKHPNEHFSNE